MPPSPCTPRVRRLWPRGLPWQDVGHGDASGLGILDLERGLETGTQLETGNGDAARTDSTLRPRFYSLFFPLLLDLELPQAVAHAGLPGSEQIPPLRSRPFGGVYHGRGRCHILGSRGVGRDVAH